MDRAWIPWAALLEELARTPERLRELTVHRGQELYVRPCDGQWSIGEIVAHLCAVEPPYRARLVRMVLEEQPQVTAIDRITGGYDPQTPVGILIDTFRTLRDGTVAFLEQLPAVARGRTAIHAELGPITLRGQVEALLTHDAEHLAQIAEQAQNNAFETSRNNPTDEKG